MKALLVDDHGLFREGLALLLQHHFHVRALLHAASLQQAVAEVTQHADLDLVLLDLGLPDSRGLDALPALHEAAPGARIVVLSADDAPHTVRSAIEQGAAGFIPKTAHADLLRRALAIVLQGGVYLPASLLGSEPPAAAPADGDARPALDLSPRQHDVLKLLVQGATNKHICRQLDLSESTVKTHLNAIFKRLEVNTRTQAVIAAARLGLCLGS